MIGCRGSQLWSSVRNAVREVSRRQPVRAFRSSISRPGYSQMIWARALRMKHDDDLSSSSLIFSKMSGMCDEGWLLTIIKLQRMVVPVTY